MRPLLRVRKFLFDGASFRPATHDSTYSYYDLNSIPHKKRLLGALRQKQKVLSSYAKTKHSIAVCVHFQQKMVSTAVFRGQVTEQYKATSMFGNTAMNGIV